MKRFEELARAARRWKAFQAAATDPRGAQASVWAETRAMLSAAPFWRAFNGGDAPALSEFPITTFEDYRSAIERSWGTGVSEISGEPVSMWARSSGSSGTQKHFPWTARSDAQHRAGSELTLPIFKAIAKRKGRYPMLPLVAWDEGATSPAGVPIRYISNHLRAEENGVYPAALDLDAELYLRWIPLYALSKRIGGFRMLTADHLYMLVQRIEEHRDDYLRHLHERGELPSDLPRPEPDTERLATVKAVLSADEPLTLGRLWPELRLLHTWRAANAGLQVERLARDSGLDLTLIDAPYASSEGPIVTPVDPDGIGGPYNASRVILEFMEPLADPNPSNVIQPWDLEAGKSYELLLTTMMGLVRYRIHDVVRCSGFFERVPMLQFERRTTSEFSIGSVTLSEAELTTAMKPHAIDPGTRWVFAPDELGRTMVLVSSRPLPPGIVEDVHAHLMEHNSHYCAVIGVQRIKPVHAMVLPPTHGIWSACRLPHPQAKPTVFLLQPPSAYETD